jgi:hypothetical protein
MKKIVFFIFISGLFSEINAQNATDVKRELTNQEQLYRIDDAFNNRNIVSDSKYEGVQGSSLIFEKYLSGKVIVNDSVITSEVVLMNIDAIADEVRFKTLNKPERALNNSKFLGVEMTDENGKIYIFKRFRVYEKAFGNALVQIISESNKLTFVKLVQKQFHRADYEDRGVISTGKPYDSFETITNYYIKKESHLFKKIKLIKNEIMGLAPPEKFQKLDKLCRDHHIGTKLDENEAVALIKTIESL